MPAAQQLAAELFPRDDEQANAAAMLIARTFGAKDAEIGTLREWKESAMEVMNKIRLQEIAAELELPLGSDIGPRILPGIKALKQQLAQAKKQIIDIIPDKCPITGAPFFMLIETPEGRTVPTYGGPYDSYTIPEFEDAKDKPLHERECHQERYDHDAGGWVDGGECITLRLVSEDTILRWDDERDHLRADLEAVNQKRLDLEGEIHGVIAHLIPKDCRIWSREGGGAQNAAASLAQSVAKVVSNLEAVRKEGNEQHELLKLTHDKLSCADSEELKRTKADLASARQRIGSMREVMHSIEALLAPHYPDFNANEDGCGCGACVTRLAADLHEVMSETKPLSTKSEAKVEPRTIGQREVWASEAFSRDLEKAREHYHIITVAKWQVPEDAKLVEAYETAREYIVMGVPNDCEDENSPNYHNCDAMGCSSCGHVVARIPKSESDATKGGE